MDLIKAGYGLILGGPIFGAYRLTLLWSDRTFAGLQELVLRKFNEKLLLLSLAALLLN